MKQANSPAPLSIEEKAARFDALGKKWAEVEAERERREAELAKPPKPLEISADAAQQLSGDLNEVVFMLEALRNMSASVSYNSLEPDDLRLVAESFAQTGGAMLDRVAVALGGDAVRDEVQ